MTRRWRIIGRHRWVAGAVITESYATDDDTVRRFTATIRGYGGWRIFEGKIAPGIDQVVTERVRAIRDRIEAGDDSVFQEGRHHDG